MPVALKQFWIRLTADRRRFGALCVAVGLGMDLVELHVQKVDEEALG